MTGTEVVEEKAYLIQLVAEVDGVDIIFVPNQLSVHISISSRSTERGD